MSMETGVIDNSFQICCRVFFEKTLLSQVLADFLTRFLPHHPPIFITVYYLLLWYLSITFFAVLSSLILTIWTAHLSLADWMVLMIVSVVMIRSYLFSTHYIFLSRTHVNYGWGGDNSFLTAKHRRTEGLLSLDVSKCSVSMCGFHSDVLLYVVYDVYSP